MDISLITTLYNYKKYIESAIISFQNQQLNGLEAEMIIVDDASTDNPMEIIKPYLDIVKYIRLDKNMGYSYAKNIGIKNSKGKYLVMLDADDQLVPGNSLTSRYNKIIKGYDLIHGPVIDYYVDNKTSSDLVPQVSPLWRQWLSSKKDASSYKYIHAQAVMLSRDIHKKIGLYDENLRFKSDREMWARIMNHGYKVGTVNNFVSIYFLHPDQMHKSKEKKLINNILQKEVEEKIERRKNDLSDVIMLQD